MPNIKDNSNGNCRETKFIIMLMTVTAAQPKPFLKWVGGKGKLVPNLRALFPDDWDNYFEPFLGGGAVYFAVHHNKKSYINDINDSLINTYLHIRDKSEPLIKRLRKIEAEYLALDEENRKSYYYQKRAEYNLLRNGVLEKSALLIFLNKTCFNGMYRENANGGFNVPYGRYANPKILHEDNLRAVSEELQNSIITNTSYYEAVKDASKNDFVYFDPPYHPLNETSSFTSYHEGDFGKNDQIALKELFDELKSRGCYVMLSNSDSEFIRELYKDHHQTKVYAARSINASASKRGKITELVITSYKPND